MGYYASVWQEHLVTNKLQNTKVCGFKLSNPEALYTAPFACRKMVVARFGELGLSFQQDRKGLDPVLLFNTPNRGLYGLWDEQWLYVYDPEITTESVEASFDHLKWLFEYAEKLSLKVKKYMNVFSSYPLKRNHASGLDDDWDILIDDWALLPMDTTALFSAPLGKFGFKPSNVVAPNEDFVFWVREPNAFPDARAFFLREVF